MKRILVIGCPGSGKSTFARALHGCTGIPLVHLDLLFWNEDRTTVPHPLFLKRLQAALEQDAWIIDGNYHSTLEQRLRRCDTVFFLDYPTQVCLEGASNRVGIARPDMPWIEQHDEEHEEFLAYIRAFAEACRPMILELLQRYADREIVIFRDRGEAERYLNCINEHERAAR